MTRSFLDGEFAPWNQGALALAEISPALNVVLLYQDALTQEWAWQKQQQMAEQAGDRKVRCVGWNFSDLHGPRAFADAVAAALEAELIVVSVYSARDLPVAFYAWAGSWLPYRRQPAGILAAVLGLPRTAGSRPRQTREQLRSVARQAWMNFALEERKLPAKSLQLGPPQSGGSIGPAPPHWGSLRPGHLPAPSH